MSIPSSVEDTRDHWLPELCGWLPAEQGLLADCRFKADVVCQYTIHFNTIYVSMYIKGLVGLSVLYCYC